MRTFFRVLLRPVFGSLVDEIDECDLGSIPSQWLEHDTEANEEE
ncbi:hypothetical protein [Streptomyces sp. VRA16 Mangrove soil]|nr:hypothetical protein [Streptomyces sp. VRA16 Mangrove soil]